MLLAITRSDILLTVHVLAVVAAFGGAMAYPLWFRRVRGGTPEQRAFFHAVQAWLGKFLITPAIVLVFATGAYLASDFDVWGEGWVLIPAGMLAVILVIGGAFLGPSEERLSRLGEDGDQREYEAVFRRVTLVTWLFIALVVAATLMMVARIPDWGGGGSPNTSGEGSVAARAGCLSCHRIGSEGTEAPGGDLSEVGAHLTPSEINQTLVDPPPGMPSYDDLATRERQALVNYLSGLH